MGLWSELFKLSARGDGALLTPGTNFPPGESAPNFPDLGQALLVASGEPLQLGTVVGAGRPAMVLIYSNC